MKTLQIPVQILLLWAGYNQKHESILTQFFCHKDLLIECKHAVFKPQLTDRSLNKIIIDIKDVSIFPNI